MTTFPVGRFLGAGEIDAEPGDLGKIERECPGCGRIVCGVGYQAIEDVRFHVGQHEGRFEGRLNAVERRQPEHAPAQDTKHPAQPDQPLGSSQARLLRPAARFQGLVEDLGRVGGVVTEPLPPQTRACAIDALGSSPARFAQDAYAPSPVRLSTAVSCTCWWNSGFPPAFPISGSVQVTLRFPRAGPDGHGSPPSAVLSERYDFLPSHVLRLVDFASRLRRLLPGFVFAEALPPPCRPDDGPGSGLFTLAIPFPAILPTGKSRISQVPWRSIP